MRLESNIKYHTEIEEFHGLFFHKFTRFYALFYVKNEVSAKTSLIFVFYCGTVSSETGEKMSELFSDFLASKNETGWWFHVWNWHKIMKPPEFGQEKKLKLTARGLWNNQPVSFSDAKKSEKSQHFFVSFTWNCAAIK